MKVNEIPHIFLDIDDTLEGKEGYDILNNLVNCLDLGRVNDSEALRAVENGFYSYIPIDHTKTFMQNDLGSCLLKHEVHNFKAWLDTLTDYRICGTSSWFTSTRKTNENIMKFFGIPFDKFIELYNPSSGSKREKCIIDYVEEHRLINWVILDDQKFTDGACKERHVFPLVPGHSLTTVEYALASKILGEEI